VKDPDTTSVRYRKEKEFWKSYDSKFSTMADEEKAKVWKQWHELREKYSNEMPSVANLADHIDYVKNLVGVDHVGIGSDFDGGGGLADCRDVSQFPNITRELVKRGYSDEEIIKIWGGNFFRAFAEVEKTAAKNKNSH